MLESSESRAAILEYATSAWRISTRQTDTYVAAACAMHKAQADTDAAYHLALALERLNKLFCDAFEARDHRTAI